MSTMIREAIGLHGPLRLVEIDDEWSLYETRTKTLVHLAHGTARVLLPTSEIDLRHEWAKASRQPDFPYTYWDRQSYFLGRVRGLTYETEQVDDEIHWCGDCSFPVWEEDLWYPDDDDSDHAVCRGCRVNYRECSYCDSWHTYLTPTLSGSRICEGCRDYYFRYCENCDGYYHHEDDDGHQHDGSGCCESPALEFAVRNDGGKPLTNDTRLTLTLPKGVISDEGVGQIAMAVRDWARQAYGEALITQSQWEALNSATYSFGTTLGESWQTKQGNYTKRLSRLAYKECLGVKLPPELISQVGNIGSDHSRAVDVTLEVTRDLNLSAEEFCHEDSCWWGSYASSRCALKTNGGYALRTFEEETNALTGQTWESVTGRAWVMPMKVDDDGNILPTFETLDPGCFVVFNGYGDLEGYAPARIVAHMAGMTYRKINFNCSPMYVNGESAYLVAPEEIARDYDTGGAIAMTVQQHSALYERESITNNAEVASEEEHVHV